MDLHLQIVQRIASAVDLPVSVDFEGGYAETAEDVAANIARLISAGAIGVNFEDQIVSGHGLYTSEVQCGRIAAIRQIAVAAEIPLFINARTDLFLKERDRSKHEGLVSEAVDRATAYARAGASGFFVPGLADAKLVAMITSATPIPANIMMMGGAPSASELARAGIARISYGPGPYREAMAGLVDRYGEIAGGT